MKDWRSWDKLTKRQRWNPVERARGWNSPRPGYIYSRRKLSKCKTSPGYCQNPLRLHPRKKIRGLPGPPRTFASNHLHLTRLSHIFSLDRRPGITASFSLAPLRTIRCPNLQRGRGSLSLFCARSPFHPVPTEIAGGTGAENGGGFSRQSLAGSKPRAKGRESQCLAQSSSTASSQARGRTFFCTSIRLRSLVRPRSFVCLSARPSVRPSARALVFLPLPLSLSLCGCSAAAALLSQRHSAVH